MSFFFSLKQLINYSSWECCHETWFLIFVFLISCYFCCCIIYFRYKYLHAYFGGFLELQYHWSLSSPKVKLLNCIASTFIHALILLLIKEDVWSLGHLLFYQKCSNGSTLSSFVQRLSLLWCPLWTLGHTVDSFCSNNVLLFVFIWVFSSYWFHMDLVMQLNRWHVKPLSGELMLGSL